MYIQGIIIKNRVYKYCFDNLVKPKTIETENILTNKKNYKDLANFFYQICSQQVNNSA